MSGYYGFGFTGGFLIGALLAVAMAIYVRDKGREECDAKLPRSQQRVQVWVPPPTANAKP